MTTRNRGGWYLPSADGGEPRKPALWTYTFKNTDDDLKTGKNLPPPLEEGSQTRFDPADQPFGLWVSNDDFRDGGVFTEPALVARINKRGQAALQGDDLSQPRQDHGPADPEQLLDRLRILDQ